jgi:hypothetical protein
VAADKSNEKHSLDPRRKPKGRVWLKHPLVIVLIQLQTIYELVEATFD